MPWDNIEEDEPLIEQPAQTTPEPGKGVGIDPSARKALNKEEWMDRLMIVRNSAVVFLAVMLFQIPFELMYAALNQQATSTMAKYAQSSLPPAFNVSYYEIDSNPAFLCHQVILDQPLSLLYTKI